MAEAKSGFPSPNSKGNTSPDPLAEPWRKFMNPSQWIPDPAVNSCMSCHANFNIFRRRHHCRRCGAVVCGSCSPHTTKFIAKDIHENTNEEEVRVCDPCMKAVDEQIALGLRKRFGFKEVPKKQAERHSRQEERVTKQDEEDKEEEKEAPLRRSTYITTGTYRAELKGSEGNRYITDDDL